MWAAFSRLEKELIERRDLLSINAQKSLMLAAASIPAPKFLAFAAFSALIQAKFSFFLGHNFE